MDFLDLAKKRYSVRGYESKKVEQKKLDKILEAARIAPTAGNTQSHRILVIQSDEGHEKLKKAGNVYKAPLAFIVCADHSASWKRPFDSKDSADIDASIVTTHMMLEAENLGLGTIWVMYFKADIVKSEFALPDGYEPISILGVGYAAGEVKSPDRHATERKPLGDIAFFEKF